MVWAWIGVALAGSFEPALGEGATSAARLVTFAAIALGGAPGDPHAVGQQAVGDQAADRQRGGAEHHGRHEAHRRTEPGEELAAEPRPRGEQAERRRRGDRPAISEQVAAIELPSTK